MEGVIDAKRRVVGTTDGDSDGLTRKERQREASRQESVGSALTKNPSTSIKNENSPLLYDHIQEDFDICQLLDT